MAYTTGNSHRDNELLKRAKAQIKRCYYVLDCCDNGGGRNAHEPDRNVINKVESYLLSHGYDNEEDGLMIVQAGIEGILR